MRKRERMALRPALDKNLSAYALAGIAGLTSMCSPAAEAAVVYTRVETVGAPNSSISIDLNQDGINDFALQDTRFSQTSFNLASLAVTALHGDEVAINSGMYANALSFGNKVGFNLEFSRNTTLKMAVHVTSSHIDDTVTSAGPFLDLRNKFLGLKLSSAGQTYYGWARVSTSGTKSISFELIDYAYETTPNTPIKAGQGIKSGAGTGAGMLGLMAHGSESLGVRRIRAAQGSTFE